MNEIIEKLRETEYWKKEWSEKDSQVMKRHREIGILTEQEMKELCTLWADYRTLYRHLLQKERELGTSPEIQDRIQKREFFW